MRWNFLIIAFLVSTSCVLPQVPFDNIGRSDYVLQVEGVQRQFIVYHPQGYTTKLLPVVFMFHGSSGNGERFYNISGWREKADKVGLITVFPSSMRYCIEEGKKSKNTTKWNDGKLEKIICKGQQLKDDVLFFREMVRFLIEKYPIDQSRIYASGFSNGANFVGRLTFEASDILAATTMFAGYLQDTSFQTTSLIPSYLAIGDLNVNSITGRLPEWGEAGIEVPGLYERVIGMLDKLELERTFKFESTDSLLTFHFDTNKGDGTNEFRFSLVKNLEHQYPNGRNHSMVAVDFFWDFFKEFSK